MSKILKVHGLQVFDSRGIPTVSCKITLENGLSAISLAPSGASTGSKEALELRDGEERYGGKGVFKAIENINNVLGPLLVGSDLKSLESDANWSVVCVFVTSLLTVVFEMSHLILS